MNATMRRKLAGLFVLAVLALILLLIRITYINAVSGEEYTKEVLSNSQSQYTTTTLAYKRGDILDANGTVLATSEKMYNVVLDCRAVNSREDYIDPTVEALVELFDLDEGDLRTLLADEKTKSSQYQVIKKNITIEEKKAYDQYVNGTDDHPLTDDIAEERALIHGVWFEEKYVRRYPLNTLASDVIGFTYDGDSADWGIEGYYNNSLKGVNGRKYGYYNSGSEIEQTIVEPTDGNSVVSTIDVNIQTIVEKYIQKYEETYQNGPNSSTEAAKDVGVIVMNPNNGAVLAMAGSRPFDPNTPRDLSAYYSDSDLAAMSDEQQVAALEDIWKNFCISDAYEPGSVFKPVTVASALESGALIGNETFKCDGYLEISGTTIKCANTSGHGEETVSDIIRNSCNVGLMTVADGMGVESFTEYQNMFGFGSRTGIDLSGEAAGIVRNSDTMSTVDLATASFGQGFTCTMIQEAAAISSVVNGGYYYRPHVVSRLVDANGTTVRSYNKILARQTISSDVSEMVKSYMKASVDDGTSVYAKVDGYTMGGKTGTAQKIPRGNGKYLVSWIGFAPYDDPQVVIYVVVDEPNVENQDDNRFPQWIARDALQEILPYLGIYQDEASDPSNVYLQMDLDNPTGEAVADTGADTNVPEVQGSEDAENTEGGNTAEEDGYTNEEAGLN